MGRSNRGKANEDLRLEVFKSGLTYREIAQAMGISFEWLSRVMSKKLTPEMRKRITEVVERLSVTDCESE